MSVMKDCISASIVVSTLMALTRVLVTLVMPCLAMDSAVLVSDVILLHLFKLDMSICAAPLQILMSVLWALTCVLKTVQTL